MTLILLQFDCSAFLEQYFKNTVKNVVFFRSQYCCQTMFNPKDFGLCPGNSSCVLADLDGSVSGSNFCAVTDDVKFENSYNRSEQEYILSILISI